MTKSHLPPRCSGNRGQVARYRTVEEERVARPGRQMTGGLHFYGLCTNCNGLQSKYDGAYAHLADLVRPLWTRTQVLLLPSQKLQLPSALFSPGGASRSMLIGMFGLSPNLRTRYPQLADDLRNEKVSIRLPGDLRLRIAIARGKRARLTGSVGGFEMFRRRLGGNPLGVMTLAQVYFPPLAWQLASNAPSLLDVEGWGDASPWLLPDPKESRPLSSMCPPLPVVLHPKHDPNGADWWCELFSDELAPLIECDDVEPLPAGSAESPG
jgi:hypothetical protein